MNIRQFRGAILGCLTTFAALSGIAAGEEVLYQESFAGPSWPSGWSRKPGIELVSGEGVGGSGCLKITAAKADNGLLISRQLDLSIFRGRGIVLEAMMKARDIAPPAKKYLGPKLMLHLKTSSGEVWQDQRKEFGSYDWKKFTTFLRVPVNAEKLDLSLGLQGTTGTLWVSSLKITAIPQVKELSPDANAGTELQKNTRLRGVMSGGAIAEKDFQELGEVWKVNLMRFQISNPRRQDTSTREKTDLWLKEQLVRLDGALPFARKYGVKILIDLHAGPGMTQTELLNNRLSWTHESQDLLVYVWQVIAKKYRDNPTVWGYDLLNEPREDDYVYTAGGALDWNRLAEKVAKAVRAIDPVKPIIVEPAIWASPEGFNTFKPINVSNVIYSVHFYAPGSFTHQGLYGRPVGVIYPGKIEGKEWNKEMMRQALAPVIAFQKKYRVPIYVGEFSAIRWAPGESARDYLRDAIEVFEENGWDWTYHAFREFEGWDAEWSNDRNIKGRQSTTPRKELLLEYFRKNQR